MKHEVPKHYQGYVPQHYPHPQTLCAYYHCPLERIDYRRYCMEHAIQHDIEALEGECKILEFAKE